jgi:hypothetical protein
LAVFLSLHRALSAVPSDYTGFSKVVMEILSFLRGMHGQTTTQKEDREQEETYALENQA